MALAKPNSTSLFGEEPDDDSFWLKLMAECLENPVTKLPPGRRLLVLGDNDAEKTLLITKLQGSSTTTDVNFTKGNGLEYRHLMVKDEYCEHQTRLGVWILDGDPFYKPLLKYALDEESLADTTVLLVASMTKPWDILDTIGTWTQILRDHIEGLNLTDPEVEARKARVLERFREYIEPGLSIYGSLAADNTRELPVNLGVEIIVVVTRTEYMKELQTEFGYEEEHFDFIQLSLREFCLSHGAALFYVSVKEDKNCDLLLKYILHRIYSFPFRLPGVLVERDSILVPAGWDTKNKIRFLSETLATIPSSTPFGDVVFRPARLSEAKRTAPEIVARSNQEFLTEMQAALERQSSEDRAPESSKVDGSGTSSSSMTATVVQRNVARRMTRAQPGRCSPQKKLEAKLVSGDGDNTLSNFFHSLLNRRTSAPVDRPVGFTGTRTLTPKGGSFEHSTTRNISTTDNRENGGRHLHGISEQNNSSMHGSRKSSEESSENDSEDSSSIGSSSRLQNTAHLSLDDQDKEAHRQLPEYFLSNTGTGFCSPDCSFQKDNAPSSSSSFDLDEEQFSPPLDRVRSSFNPPLKLLLEKRTTEGKNQKELLLTTNGEQTEGKNRKELLVTTNGEQTRNTTDDLKNGSAPGFEKITTSNPMFSGLVNPGDSVMSSTPSSSMPFKTNNHDQNSVGSTS